MASLFDLTGDKSAGLFNQQGESISLYNLVPSWLEF